jgi:uncharacterized membrane protein
MTYSPLLIVHICGGLTAILSGSAALVARKGCPLHRRSGDVFVISMLSMAASGGYLALTKSELLNVVAAVFTLYLVATAWLTARRTEKEIGLAELGLLLMALAAGTGSLILGWQEANGATGSRGSAAPFFVFGAVAWLSAAGDVRMVIRGGVSGAQRLARHLWRMCVAMFIAAASFFLGMSGDPALRRSGLRARLFPETVRRTHLPEVPVLIIVILTIFWLCRVLFTNAYKKTENSASLRRSFVHAVGDHDGVAQGAAR